MAKQGDKRRISKADGLFFRVKRNETAMMHKRGYDIKHPRLIVVQADHKGQVASINFADIDVNPFAHVYPNIDQHTKEIFEFLDSYFPEGINASKTRMSFSMEYTSLDKKKKAIVMYLDVEDGKKGIGKSSLDVWQMLVDHSKSEEEEDGEIVYTSAYDEHILITTGQLTPSAMSVIRTLEASVTIFTDDDFMVDIFKHAAAPIEYKIWQPDEYSRFIAEEGVEPKRLPLVRTEDPFVKRLGLVEGCILRTLLPLPGRNAGDIMVDYRLVRG